MGDRPDLKNLLRGLSRRTSVEELRRKGVERVSVVGLDRIVRLIEEAMRASVRSQVPYMEQDRIVAETRETFLRRMNEPARTDAQREAAELESRKQAAEEELQRLREEVTSQRQELEERLATVRESGLDGDHVSDSLLQQRVRELFEQLAATATEDLATIQAAVQSLLQECLGEERERLAADAQATVARDVDLLQRRLDKVTKALEEAEYSLVHAVRPEDVDEGIASIYRSVQGLRGSDPRANQKKGLLDDIFTANLKLQKGG